MTVTIQLEDDLVAALERRAEREGLSLAQVADGVLRGSLNVARSDARKVAWPRPRTTLEEWAIRSASKAEAVRVPKQMVAVYCVATILIIVTFGIAYGTLRMAGMTKPSEPLSVLPRMVDESPRDRYATVHSTGQDGGPGLDAVRPAAIG